MSRREHDLLGDKEIPAGAYYGINTARAAENFAVSGISIGRYPHLLAGLSYVKQAAAQSNHDLGLLDIAKTKAIVNACHEIREGKLHDQFIVDVIQGGAGTSTNMNANEVIANRALEILGHLPGDYGWLHPIDDVNLGQSTNDVYPTSAKIALQLGIAPLLAAIAKLEKAFADKSQEFAGLIKLGRTQLQDAVPMTLGQEFGSYATMLGEDQLRLAEAQDLLCEINLGGTAIGTGLNTHARYQQLVCEHLARLTGLTLFPANDLVAATQDVGAFVQLSSVLKRIAIKLSKICNDLRLLASGPRAGFGEISLPAVQAGSSAMPGKVNPVIPELVNQIAFQVVGNDLTVSMAAEAGQLQLNAFEPIIFRSLFDGIGHLTAGIEALSVRCVPGIVAHPERIRRTAESSSSLAAALIPHLGYAGATALAQEAAATDRSVYELIRERRLLSPANLDAFLPPARR